MGGKSTTTQQQQTTTIPPEVLARYNAVNASAEQAANTPFQIYSTDPNAFVAPLNPVQQAAIGNIAGLQGAYAPFYGAGAALTGQAVQAAQPLTGDQIGQYMSPYLNTVLGAQAALQNQANQQAMSGQLANAIRSGAFGSDRAGIAAANLAQQQQLANAQIYSGILNQGYQQALSAAQQQQQLGAQTALQAGQQIAGLGTGLTQAGLGAAQALLGAGTAQQQTQQAGLQALYNQFLQQQAYPFQTAQFLANIAEGTGALSGSTTAGTTTQPSSFFGNIFSDERVKEDIHPVGKTNDGQTIYKFRYKDDPEKTTHMGLLAQEVEKHKPEAVGEVSGIKTVNYDKATEDAERHHRDAGGLVPSRWSQPSASDWAKAQAGDTWNTIRHIVGYDSDNYEPFAQTRRLGQQSASAASTERADTQPEGRYVGGIAPESMGGPVTPESAGLGFAAGGSPAVGSPNGLVDRFDLAAILQAQQQALGLYGGAGGGVYGRPAGGTPGVAGYVPAASGAVPRLITGNLPRPPRQDQISPAQLASTIKSGTELYDWWNKPSKAASSISYDKPADNQNPASDTTTPTATGNKVSQLDTPDSSAYRGGVVGRHHYDAGGLPYSSSGLYGSGLEKDDQNEIQKLNEPQLQSAGQQSSAGQNLSNALALGKLGSMAASAGSAVADMLPMLFLASGGVAGRQGHADGEAVFSDRFVDIPAQVDSPDETPRNQFIRQRLEEEGSRRLPISGVVPTVAEERDTGRPIEGTPPSLGMWPFNTGMVDYRTGDVVRNVEPVRAERGVVPPPTEEQTVAPVREPTRDVMASPNAPHNILRSIFGYGPTGEQTAVQAAAQPVTEPAPVAGVVPALPEAKVVPKLNIFDAYEGRQRVAPPAAAAAAAPPPPVAPQRRAFTSDEIQSNNRPVINPDGTINWGNPDQPQDFVRASNALKQITGGVASTQAAQDIYEGRQAAGVAPAAAPAPGGTVPAPEPRTVESMMRGAPSTATSDLVTRSMPVIGGMESGNRYNNVTTTTNKKTGQPQSALGRYGIMDFNVPTWTKEVLGRSFTADEFLRDREAQDAVFRAKFGQYVDKYGPEGAAQAWLGGPGSLKAPASVADAFGTTPQAYGQKYMSRIGATDVVGPDSVTRQAPTEQIRGVVPAAAPAAGVPTGLAAAQASGAPAVAAPTAGPFVGLGGGAPAAGGLEPPINAVTGRPYSSWGEFASSRQFLIPLLQGIGAMASSPSRYLGAAALQGIGAGAGAYAQEAQREAQLAQTQQAVRAAEFATEKGAMQITPYGNFVWVRDASGRIIPVPAGQYNEQVKRGEALPSAAPPPLYTQKLLESLSRGEQFVPPIAGQPGAPTTPGQPKTEAPAAEPTTAPRAQFDDQSRSTAAKEQSQSGAISGGPAAQIAADRSKRYITEADAGAQASRENFQNMGELGTNLAKTIGAKGLNAPGFAFGERGQIASVVNTLSRAFGGEDFLSTDTAAQIANKIKTLQGRMAAQGAGQESIRALELLANANANPEMNPKAFAPLYSLAMTLAQRNIDRQNHATRYGEVSGNLFQNAAQDFERLNPKSNYDKEAKAIEEFLLQKPGNFQRAMQGFISAADIDRSFEKKYGIKNMSRYFTGGF